MVAILEGEFRNGYVDESCGRDVSVAHYRSHILL